MIIGRMIQGWLTQKWRQWKQQKRILDHTKNQIMMKLFKANKGIQRPGDLTPKGVKSTIRGNYSFNEVMQHIFNEGRKPDPLWKSN
jgi:hypothetical protein